MAESILDSVKKNLDINTEDLSFDVNLITHINSVFMILTQLGAGPEVGFSITNKDATWEQFLSEQSNMNGVKSYMFLRVKALFDPASTSFTQEALNNQREELEWRIIHQIEEGQILPPVTP